MKHEQSPLKRCQMKRSDYHAELARLCYMYSRNERGTLTCWTRGYFTAEFQRLDAFRVETKSKYVKSEFMNSNGLTYLEMFEPQFTGEEK